MLSMIACMKAEGKPDVRSHLSENSRQTPFLTPFPPVFSIFSRRKLARMVGYHLVRLSQGTVMQTDTLVPRTLRSTATELRKLPPKQRDAILEVAAALAERDYHDNVELNAFDAFGKDDLHGDSSSAQTR